jgi:hypothetical protein
MTYGFWLSAEFKGIVAGVSIFLFGMLSLEQGILFKLKKKERKITQALEQANENCLIKHYQTEREIIWVQRKKGIDVL